MEISLFLYGNSAEMREIEGNVMYIFIYVSLIGNGTMAGNKKYLGGGIIFHGLEYLIRHEVVFCFIF